MVSCSGPWRWSTGQYLHLAMGGMRNERVWVGSMYISLIFILALTNVNPVSIQVGFGNQNSRFSACAFVLHLKPLRLNPTRSTVPFSMSKCYASHVKNKNVLLSAICLILCPVRCDVKPSDFWSYRYSYQGDLAVARLPIGNRHCSADPFYRISVHWGE